MLRSGVIQGVSFLHDIDKRPEWAVVSMLSQEHVRTEALKHLKMRDSSNGIEEWLVIR